MKLITRDTDYAVRVLCFIAQKEKEIFSVNDLVEELKIPKPFLRRILQLLNKNRILCSYKGRGGGFIMAHPAGKVYLIDLIEIFQGTLKINECLFKKHICPNIRVCSLKKKIDNIERNVLTELKSIKISDLLKNVKKKNHKN